MSDLLNLLVSRPGGVPEELSVSFTAQHRIGDLTAAPSAGPARRMYRDADRGPFHEGQLTGKFQGAVIVNGVDF